MTNPGDQLPLFGFLPEVRQPAKTIRTAENVVRRAANSKKTRKTSSIIAETDTVELEPLETVVEPTTRDTAVCIEQGAAVPAPANAANGFTNSNDVTTLEDADHKQLGQLEAEELRRRNSRADRLEDRSNDYGKAFLRFAILYLAAKAGIPVYHFLLAKLSLPPMDGTLVSAGIGIACTWHYSQMLTHALLAREHVYQFEIKFGQMSGWGKFAMLLQWLTNVALFALFAVVAIWTVIDIISVFAYLIEYWHWKRGTTIEPIRPK